MEQSPKLIQMNRSVNALLSELKRMKRDGQERVFIDDKSLNLLKGVKRKNNQEQPNLPSPPKISETPEPIKEPELIPPRLTIPDISPAEQLDWIRATIAKCSVCLQNKTRYERTIQSSGNIKADVFFCIDSPGADEATHGELLIGQTGELFKKILEAMGLKRTDVYVSSILKWRPIDKSSSRARPPKNEEINFCLNYFKAELSIIKPKLIVTLGNSTLPLLLGPDPKYKLAKIRGTFSEWETFPIMATFHPSYLHLNDTLRTKRLFWEDMLQVMDKVNIPISEKQQAYFLPKK